MEEIKILIKNKDTQSAISLLDKFSDERVVRFTLNLAIEDNNQALFDATLSRIRAPQYLGPQLVLATEKNLTNMAKKLMLCVQDKYYLTKTLETALKNEMPDIYNHIYDTTLKYDKRFLKKIELELAAKTLVRNAEKLMENIDAPHSNSDAILANAFNQHMSEQFSLNEAQAIPQAKADNFIAGNLSILLQQKKLKQSTLILQEQPNTISPLTKSAVNFDSNVVLPVLANSTVTVDAHVPQSSAKSAVAFDSDVALPSPFKSAVSVDAHVSQSFN